MIRPAPHHGELAARVGTARETVARALAELARKRVVERQGDALVVRDPNRLAAMVEDVWGTQNSRR
jgi:DNA-binding GntR family transcriptional regulator